MMIFAFAAALDEFIVVRDTQKRCCIRRSMNAYLFFNERPHFPDKG